MSTPSQAVQGIQNWAQSLPNTVQGIQQGANALVPDWLAHMVAPHTVQSGPNPLQQGAQAAEQYIHQRLSDATAQRVRARVAQILGGM